MLAPLSLKERMRLKREAKKKKPERVYVTPIIKLPINIRYSAKAEFDLIHEPYALVDSMLNGKAELSEWKGIYLRVMFGNECAKAYFNEGQDQTAKAMKLLEQVKQTGFRITESERYRLFEALNWVDEMQKNLTRKDQLAVMRGVYNTVKSLQ